MARDAVPAAVAPALRQAYARLRAIRPARLIAIVGEEAHEIRLSGRRGRWERALATAHELGAEELRALDGAGAVMAVLKLVEQRADEEDEETAATSHAAEVRALVALALDAADRAVLRTSEQQQQVLEAALSVMRAASERAERLERALAAVVRAHERALAAARDEQESPSDKLAEQALALALAQMGGGHGPA